MEVKDIFLGKNMSAKILCCPMRADPYAWHSAK